MMAIGASIKGMTALRGFLKRNCAGILSRLKNGCNEVAVLLMSLR